MVLPSSNMLHGSYAMLNELKKLGWCTDEMHNRLDRVLTIFYLDTDKEVSPYE